MDIPKKPLAVSRAKKKLPVELDWGPGIPKDRLRYINAREEALIKRFRKSKAARDYAGIPAYPDPGDTAAGEKGKTGTTTGKTTGPGSSSGGTGQGGQNKGPSNASNSASGTSKTASSGSKTASSGSKSPSSSPTSTSSGSKAPNAAAQAASDKLNGKTSGSTPAKTNASAPVSPSKAPNMAASYAAQKLNASQGIQKAASQPKSIQSMINAGQIAPNGSYYGPKGVNKLNSAAYTAANRPAQMAPNGSYYGPKGVGALNADARFAAARSVGFNPDPVKRTPGDAEAMGRMMMAESSVIKNQYGNPLTAGLQGVGDVIRNRMLSSHFPNTVQEVIRQRNQFSPMNRDTIDKTGLTMYERTPANDVATRIAESILSGESPSVVGNALNYSNEHTVQNKPGYASSETQASVNAMPKEVTFADYKNPRTYSHTFGTRNIKSDVSFNGTGNSLGSVGLAAAAPEKELDLASQPMKAIPEPKSVGYPGLGNTTVASDPRLSVPQGSYPAAPPKSAFTQDPRLSVPQGAYPAAKPPSAFTQDPRLSVPQGAYPAAKPPSAFAQDPRLSVPQGAYPAATPSSVFAQDPRLNVPQGAYPAAPPNSVFAQDPRVSMRPGSYPAGPEERVLSVENYIDTTGIRDPQAATMSAPQPQQQGPLPASIPGFAPPGLSPNFRGTAGVASTGVVPGWGYSPLADGRPAPDSSGYGPSGWTSPSTFAGAAPGDEQDRYNPEAAPGDEVPEDDPTYSDSPVQGSENPMQAESPVEEPAVKQQRQNKYASRGATIGSVIAGPLGALIGGTLGWQMGKATPGQKRAIANSPQALNANAQSINRLVEERGGKNEPNMRVRPEALKAVLTNPKMVLDQPEGFTDLEQMLAALAAGLDPETGKQL